MRPGISTVGVKFAYAVEETAGTKPTAFTQLDRINQIGSIGISRESIDASALEDELTKRIAGRGTTDETLPVNVNVTNETIAEWEALITAYETAKAADKAMWFETYFPDLTKSYFFTAEPPTAIPQPEIGQNGLHVMEMTLIVNEYKGLDTAIVPTANSAANS